MSSPGIFDEVHFDNSPNSSSLHPKGFDECSPFSDLIDRADVCSRTRGRKRSICTPHNEPTGDLRAAFTQDKGKAAHLPVAVRGLNQSL